MANDQRIELLEAGVGEWNDWCHSHPGLRADFRDADLEDCDFRGANLFGADLSKRRSSIVCLLMGSG